MTAGEAELARGSPATVEQIEDRHGSRALVYPDEGWVFRFEMRDDSRRRVLRGRIGGGETVPGLEPGGERPFGAAYELDDAALGIAGLITGATALSDLLAHPRRRGAGAGVDTVVEVLLRRNFYVQPYRVS